MSTGKTALIVVISVVAVALIIVFIVGMSYVNIQNHTRYCSNWSDNLEKQRAQIEGQLFADPTQFNQEISEFNKECAY